MRPEDILADNQSFLNQDGQQLRKGSVAAFMANIRILQDKSATHEHATAKTHLLELMPTLQALGFFELFEVKDEKIKQMINLK